MASPRGHNAGRRGERSSLPPEKLWRLTDQLVEVPVATLRNIGVDPNTPSDTALSAEEIYRWQEILDDARDLELAAAPSLGEYVTTGASASLAVAGLGLAFTGPVFGPVIASAALVVGGASGLVAFWESGRVIRKDITCGDRLSAIEWAQEVLRIASQ